MVGFEWKPPEYVEEWRAKEKTPEEQILFELMDHVMSEGVRLGLMSMPYGSPREIIKANVPESFIRRMQAVNPDNWLAEMLPPVDGPCKFEGISEFLKNLTGEEALFIQCLARKLSSSN